MPVQVSYPGVYVEEIPSTPNTVTSATTAATAFADFFVRGPMGQAVQVNNFTEFQRTFGGLNERSEASYGIMQYFNNGGQTAWVVRLGDGSAKAAQLAVTVVLPQAAQLATQASQAATQAQQQAQKAQQAVSNSDPATAAQLAGQAAQAAAEATLQAASATGALAQELDLDIQEYNATYGTEAGSTYDAAQAAADAAADASAAAQAASSAAQDAAAAATTLSGPPQNAAKEAAAEATKAALGSGTASASPDANATNAAQANLNQPLTLTSANVTAINNGSFTIPSGVTGAAATAYTAAATLQADLTAALDGSPSPSSQANQALQTLVQPVGAVLSAAAGMLLNASSTTALVTQAANDAANAGGGTPTVSVNTVNNDVTNALNAAQGLSTSATALASAASAALSALQQSGLQQADPNTDTFDELQTDLEALTGTTASPANPGDVAAVQQQALATTGWLQVAQAAVTSWVAATQEDDAMTDAGAAAAAATAQQNATAAQADGQQLQNADAALVDALFPGDSLASILSDLSAAATAFAALAAGNPPSNLGNVVSDLKNAAAEAGGAWATAASGTAGGTPLPSSLQTQVAGFAAETESAYLSAVIAQDLSVAMVPLDTAQSAAAAAADAAKTAAYKASVAAAKAKQAAMAAEEDQAAQSNDMTIAAANPGTWGNSVQVTITTRPGNTFDLLVQEMAVRGGQLKAVQSESYPGLTLASQYAPKYAVAMVNAQSQLVTLSYSGPKIQGAYPQSTPSAQKLAGGANGNPPRASDLFPTGLPQALQQIAPNTFNILCLPITATYSATQANSAITQAMQLCQENNAFYIVDIPSSVDTVSKMQTWMSGYGNASAYYSAVYYPRLLMPDPIQNYRLRNVGPSGTLAGIYAGNDLNYGVWETPAGINATISGAQLAANLSDQDNGTLNELGINCLRVFPVYGTVVWGGRTMAGADQIGSQWKYINVRRLADYIEDSLLQSLRWVVFQNNDARLWSQISFQVGSFMSGLFAAGAFAGTQPSSAYLVQCDSSTTTQTDIDNGIVNILVGFAPEYPAEFVILQIEQLAGQTAS